MEQGKWSVCLESLVTWAAEKGYHVEFVYQGDDSMCHISKLIEIDSALSLEKQVIHLLHECGHVLVFGNKDFFDFIKIRNSYSETSNTFKVFRVIEEQEAWKRGFKLAKRLHIPIDEDKWEKSMVKALKKYIDWAAN